MYQVSLRASACEGNRVHFFGLPSARVMEVCLATWLWLSPWHTASAFLVESDGTSMSLLEASADSQ